MRDDEQLRAEGKRILDEAAPHDAVKHERARQRTLHHLRRAGRLSAEKGEPRAITAEEHAEWARAQGIEYKTFPFRVTHIDGKPVPPHGLTDEEIEESTANEPRPRRRRRVLRGPSRDSRDTA